MTVSLIIRTFNPNREWFEQALSSVPKNLFNEVVIVDDGSKPPVPEATLFGENNGLGMARNHGVEKATGDWIATLDDDDYFDDRGIRDLFAFCSENQDADIIHFPCEIFGSSNGQWGLNSAPTIQQLLQANQVVSSAWHKRKVWEKLKGFRINECEDWDFWLRAKAEGFKFVYFPKPVYWHRIHQKSTWEKYGKSHLDETRRGIANYYFATYGSRYRLAFIRTNAVAHLQATTKTALNTVFGFAKVVLSGRLTSMFANVRKRKD